MAVALNVHVLSTLAAHEHGGDALDIAQLQALHDAVSSAHSALALALASEGEGAEVESAPMLSGVSGHGGLPELRTAALAANAALRAFLAAAAASVKPSSSSSPTPSSPSLSSGAASPAALPAAAAAAAAALPAECLGSAGNRGLVLPLFFVLFSCLLLSVRIAVDGSRWSLASGGAGAGAAGAGARPQQPELPTQPEPVALEEWSTGLCNDPKWGGEVFNVTTDIKPIHPRVPWTYGNTYGAQGDRLFAIRHVLDTHCDHLGRYVVTRTNNKDVQAASYVLTNFYWDIPDTLAKAGVAGPATPVYFFIDTLMDEALSHWLGESAVWLPLWARIRAQFPHAKLMLKPHPKSYKWEALDLYGIPRSDVVYGPPFPHPCSNLVLFPPLILYNQWDTDLAMVASVWAAQTELFRRRSGLGPRCSAPTRPVPRLLLMPRGHKENYAANDGIAARRNESEEALLWARAQAELGGVLFLTDTAPDLQTQIAAVDAASVVVVVYGSALFFNEAIARNATVIALGDLGHHDIMNTFRAIHDLALRSNRVLIVPKPYTAELVMGHIRAAMQRVEEGGSFPLNFPCQEAAEGG